MSLSIISTSRSQFLEDSAAPGSPSQATTTVELSFESTRDATLARQALVISKHIPAVFQLLPGFRKYDPTSCLPPAVREKAVRLFPRNQEPNELDDVTGVVSSLYNDSGTLMGSMVSAAFDTPLAHAIRLYDLLRVAPKSAVVKYDPKLQRVSVSFGPRPGAFWFDSPQLQIQTHDLQETLQSGKLLCIALPMSPTSYEEFMGGAMSNATKRFPDDFIRSQNVSDWLFVDVSQDRVVRRNWELDGAALTPKFTGKSISAAHWFKLTEPSVQKL